MTVPIPEPLYDRIRQRAERSGISIGSLIIRAVEEIYGEQKGGRFVRGPMVAGLGKLGPAFPHDENPHDVIFS